MGFAEIGDPAQISFRHTEFRGEIFHTCSDGCKWVFEREPEKYIQAWLPVHQIYQGNCGGASVPEVLEWYGIQPGDGGEYKDGPDAQAWALWHSDTKPGDTQPNDSDNGSEA